MEATLISPFGRTTLDSRTLSIGSASDNQLVTDDPEAAAHHAEIKPGPDGTAHLVIDLSSIHGTFVNEERLSAYTPRQLNAGDVIRIGSLHLTYETTGIANPYEPIITPSTSSYEPTTAAVTPHADDGVLQTHSPASTNDMPPDYLEQSSTQSAYSPSDLPPALDQGGMPQRPGKRMGLWIAIAIVVILVAGSAWGTYSYINRSTPTKTLQAFCTAFQKGDAQELYNLLSKRTQVETSIDNLKAVFGFLEYAGGVQNCTVDNVRENGSTATGNVTMNLKGGKPGLPYPQHLINEEGTWKIDDSHNQH